MQLAKIVVIGTIRRVDWEIDRRTVIAAVNDAGTLPDAHNTASNTF